MSGEFPITEPLRLPIYSIIPMVCLNTSLHIKQSLHSRAVFRGGAGG